LLYIDSLKNQLSTEIQILQIATDVEKSLSGLGTDADAVYVSYLHGRNATEINIIAKDLISKKIPSFSSQKFHVDNGIMACISDKNDFGQVIRKLSIMVDESVNGELLSEMPVNINFKEDLFLNSRTVKEIGTQLSFEILFTANFVDDEQDLPVYSLEEVMQRALENNFGIKITNQDITLAIQDAKFAKTAVLPFLDMGMNGRQINEESSFAMLNQPERQLAGELVLDQLIYSEEAMAGIKIAYYLQKAQESATDAEILQILLNTYFDYFTVLAAKTVLDIETENLENLKTNLELARIRVNSGSASRAEILRWESEVAIANQTVIEANTNLYNTKFQLNTSLANTLENEFDIADVTIDDTVYRQFSENIIAQFIDNPQDIEVVSRFLVNESVNNNPNKRALLEQINAVNRRNLQNKRLLYTPNIALQAQMQQILARGGAGSNVEEFNVPDNTWRVGIGLSYPIFAGKKRRVNLQTTRIQLEQLNNSRLQLDQELELAVKTSLTNTIATATNIEFSRVSSVNAVDNYELVRDQYQAGEVNITQLIDAQQSALAAKQRFAVAVYDYLQTQLQLEYSVGFFSMLATDQELEEFRGRFLDYRNNL
jgi:outer membrane protein TolC